MTDELRKKQKTVDGKSAIGGFKFYLMDQSEYRKIISGMVTSATTVVAILIALA